MHTDVLNFKKNLAAGRDPSIVEVFQNFVLSINRNAFSIGEILKINTMALAPEAQLDPVVHQAFRVHPLANAHLGEQVNCPLLQHPGADTLF